MSYNQTELTKIRFHAEELAGKSLIAYWVEDKNKDFHIARALESFAQVADLMGYDITKREKPVETEAA